MYRPVAKLKTYRESKEEVVNRGEFSYGCIATSLCKQSVSCQESCSEELLNVPGRPHPKPTSK